MILSQHGEIDTGRIGLLDWQIEFQPDQNIVLVRTSGAIDKTSFGAMLTALFAVAERYQATRILADHRNSNLKLNPLEIYYAPRVIADSGGRSDHILALVFTKMTEDIQFLENVCRNAGLSLAVFMDSDAGFQWLSHPVKPALGKPQSADPEKPANL